MGVPKFIDHHVLKYSNPANAQNARLVRDAVAQEVNDYFEDNGDKTFSMNMLGWNRWIFSVYDHVGGSKTHYMWATGYAFGHSDYNIMYSFESATPHGYSSTECVSSDAQAEATCLHNIHNAAVWVLKGGAFWADHQEGSAFQKYSGG